MSAISQFLVLAAIEVGGLFVIWFLIKSRVKRYLELESLLSGVREEARALVLELNETADRNVSLVEDRISALRELLDDVDRRIGVEKKELRTRDTEREVYARLNKRRPIVPAGESPIRPASLPSEAPIPLSLGRDREEAPEPRQVPAVHVAEESLIPAKTKRDEALELYRRGFSADLIAARLGSTVAEMELLIEMEERRGSSGGGA